MESLAWRGRVAVMAHERTWNGVACMHGHGRGGQASATDENATPKKRLIAELAPGDHRAPMAAGHDRQRYSSTRTAPRSGTSGG
jgi:hypothetical protein